MKQAKITSREVISSWGLGYDLGKAVDSIKLGAETGGKTGRDTLKDAIDSIHHHIETETNQHRRDVWKKIKSKARTGQITPRKKKGVLLHGPLEGKEHDS